MNLLSDCLHKFAGFNLMRPLNGTMASLGMRALGALPGVPGAGLLSAAASAVGTPNAAMLAHLTARSDAKNYLDPSLPQQSFLTRNLSTDDRMRVQALQPQSFRKAFIPAATRQHYKTLTHPDFAFNSGKEQDNSHVGTTRAMGDVAAYTRQNARYLQGLK